MSSIRLVSLSELPTKDVYLGSLRTKACLGNFSHLKDPACYSKHSGCRLNVKYTFTHYNEAPVWIGMKCLYSVIEKKRKQYLNCVN